MVEPEAVAFWVDDTPRPKARARTGKWGGVTPQGTRDFENLVGWTARAAARIALDSTHSWMLIAVVFEGNRPSGHQGDWDNYGKAVSDALTGIVWADDRQVMARCAVVRDTTRVGTFVYVTPGGPLGERSFETASAAVWDALDPPALWHRLMDEGRGPFAAWPAHDTQRA